MLRDLAARIGGVAAQLCVGISSMRTWEKAGRSGSESGTVQCPKRSDPPMVFAIRLHEMPFSKTVGFA